jgi:hypothetical protein
MVMHDMQVHYYCFREESAFFSGESLPRPIFFSIDRYYLHIVGMKPAAAAVFPWKSKIYIKVELSRKKKEKCFVGKCPKNKIYKNLALSH